eukprot:TRINITY_DN1211_c0_g1_i3.p1 TRINITY_DN1211_c0_g1~~TRINITY_DN1211_c0_g1_i3.p1  ORF type:complete len:612 (+),score=140.59 TRINITY_DN1211_c0_g1_i3:216-2051(+)
MVEVDTSVLSERKREISTLTWYILSIREITNRIQDNIDDVAKEWKKVSDSFENNLETLEQMIKEEKLVITSSELPDQLMSLLVSGTADRPVTDWLVHKLQLKGTKEWWRIVDGVLDTVRDLVTDQIQCLNELLVFKLSEINNLALWSSTGRKCVSFVPHNITNELVNLASSLSLKTNTLINQINKSKYELSHFFSWIFKVQYKMFSDEQNNSTMVNPVTSVPHYDSTILGEFIRSNIVKSKYDDKIGNLISGKAISNQNNPNDKTHLFSKFLFFKTDPKSSLQSLCSDLKQKISDLFQSFKVSLSSEMKYRNTLIFSRASDEDSETRLTDKSDALLAPKTISFHHPKRTKPTAKSNQSFVNLAFKSLRPDPQSEDGGVMDVVWVLKQELSTPTTLTSTSSSSLSYKKSNKKEDNNGIWKLSAFLIPSDQQLIDFSFYDHEQFKLVLLTNKIGTDQYLLNVVEYQELFTETEIELETRRSIRLPSQIVEVKQNQSSSIFKFIHDSEMDVQKILSNDESKNITEKLSKSKNFIQIPKSFVPSVLSTSPKGMVSINCEKNPKWIIVFDEFENEVEEDEEAAEENEENKKEDNEENMEGDEGDERDEGVDLASAT